MEIPREVYFIGIGGIGMSALARWFKARGAAVSGYDKTPTPLTEALVREGIPVHFGENISLVPKNPGLVVYTPAIPASHKELAFYREGNYQLVKRAQALGMLAQRHFTVAVAGTHGKTTTSSMIAHLLKQAGMDCTAFIGGIMANYESNVLLGTGDGPMVVEADEYDRSFLALHPDMAVITAMDADHLDIYGDAASVRKSFSDFAGQVKKGGTLLVKKGLVLPVNHSTYGLHGADHSAANISVKGGQYLFDYQDAAGKITGLALSMPGRHNVENAVAAIAVARKMSVDDGQIKAAVASYRGVKRRFEYIIRQDNLAFIDDYAHHPEELKACIAAARELYPGKKITGVFQPHLFSRTRDFAEGFGRSLSALDEVILLPIYPARELPIEGVTSEMLLSFIGHHNKIHCPKEGLLAELKKRNIEVLLTLGAGDIDALVQPVKKLLSK